MAIFLQPLTDLGGIKDARLHFLQSERGCGKVMFLHLSVSHSFHRVGRGV